ncbi:hypothetical protein BH23THE1_BH23THE1_09400 [soil metagenome]
MYFDMYLDQKKQKHLKITSLQALELRNNADCNKRSKYYPDGV